VARFEVVITQQTAQVRILLTGPSIETIELPHNQFESWGFLTDERLTFVLVGDTGFDTWSYPYLFQRVSATQRIGISGGVERANASRSEIRGTMSGDIEWFDSSIPPGPEGRPAGVCRATDHSVVLRRQ
jgi:hypothetical protein